MDADKGETRAMKNMDCGFAGLIGVYLRSSAVPTLYAEAH
jgi:hypothetical protein